MFLLCFRFKRMEHLRCTYRWICGGLWQVCSIRRERPI